ncbi:MAG: hypothetical protein P8I94_04465 [Emcibacteraceae bacterium]|nr:hypothetical protein [Emcibacteraceae bacterium]
MAINFEILKEIKTQSSILPEVRAPFPDDQFSLLKQRIKLRLSDRNMFNSGEFIEYKLLAYWLGSCERSLFLYDQAFKMINQDQIAGAAILARSLLENIGSAMLFTKKMRAAAKKGTDENFIKVHELFSNSCRFLLILDNDPSQENLHLTSEARARRKERKQSPPKTIHVNDGLKEASKRVKRKFHTTAKQMFDDAYHNLSEATHPSRSSVYHSFLNNYTETSMGVISHKQHLHLSCIISLSYFWLVYEDYEEIMLCLENRLKDKGENSLLDLS